MHKGLGSFLPQHGIKPGMVAHAFYPSSQEEKWKSRSLASSLATTQWVQGPALAYIRTCQKRKGGAEARKRERIREGADRQTDTEVILFWCSFTQHTVSSGRLSVQDLALGLLECAWFSENRMGCQRSWGSAAGSGFRQNIWFSATHAGKRLSSVMFVCFLEFDEKKKKPKPKTLPIFLFGCCLLLICNAWLVTATFMSSYPGDSFMFFHPIPQPLSTLR